MSRRIAPVEFVLAVLAVVGAVLLWRGGVRVDDYGPLLPGSAGFTSTYYAGPWIGGAVAVLGLAALLVIDGVRRTVSGKSLRPGETG